MKKKYILCAILCGALATAANAQITVTRAHLVVSNQRVIQAVDTSTKPTIATPGANKTWNFSSLVTTSADTLTFGNADWYPGYQAFPNANMALTNSSDDSSVTFLLVDNSQLEVEGVNDYSYQGSSQAVKQKFIALPATYNSTWKDSSTFTSDGQEVGIDPDGPGPFPMVDSVRGSFKLKSDAIVNGWGTLTTPLGSFPSIMVTSTRTTSQSFEMYSSGSWQPVPNALAQMFGFSDTTTTEYNVMWWTNDATVGFPLVDYTYLPGETNATEVNWLKVKPATSGTNALVDRPIHIYPNPATSMLRVSSVFANSVRISDLQGKVLIQVKGSENFNINLSTLGAGVYIVSVYNQDALVGTEKLIKK